MSDVIDQVVAETGWPRERAEAFAAKFPGEESGAVVAAAAIVHMAEPGGRCPTPHTLVELKLTCDGSMTTQWSNTISIADVVEMIRDAADQLARGEA